MAKTSPINSVSLFHSLGVETVKQEANNRNRRGNNDETTSLKLLANKIVQRNRTGNKYETFPQNGVSSHFLPETKPIEEPIPPILHEDYEERVAIAEYDGGQSVKQAHRIAYLDAFTTLLSNTLVNNCLHINGDWFMETVRVTQDLLKTQGMSQPE
jgi:hypothetical protein